MHHLGPQDFRLRPVPHVRSSSENTTEDTWTADVVHRGHQLRLVFPGPDMSDLVRSTSQSTALISEDACGGNGSSSVIEMTSMSDSGVLERILGPVGEDATARLWNLACSAPIELEGERTGELFMAREAWILVEDRKPPRRAVSC